MKAFSPWKLNVFFRGAALYIDGVLCVSLSPVGLAFKLPESEVEELIQNGQAVPLKYFPQGHIKKGCALFDEPDLVHGQKWKPYFQRAINHLIPPQKTKQTSLNEKSLVEGVAYLCDIDPDLQKIVAQFGNPPLWDREPGFPTLIHIILEQQVSLASAMAAFTKMEKAAEVLTPDRFLAFTDIELREFGFSRQKTRYGRILSEAIISGELDLAGLQNLDDTAAHNALIQIKGIGPWTADIYLLMALLRPDIWPVGDLALVKAAQKIKQLSEKNTPEQWTEIANPWRPHRAVAARILWHYYLSRK